MHWAYRIRPPRIFSLRKICILGARLLFIEVELDSQHRN